MIGAFRCCLHSGHVQAHAKLTADFVLTTDVKKLEAIEKGDAAPNI